MISKILFITLSNIGDVLLTLPVLDLLKNEFPHAEITVMVGPRPVEIFQGNPNIHKLIIYDKHSGIKEKIKLFSKLGEEKFDVVVDLRNTLFGALLPAKHRIYPLLVIPKNVVHMKDRHLYKVASSQFSALRLRSGLMVSVPRPCSGLVLSLSQDEVEPSAVSKGASAAGGSLNIRQDDKEYIEEMLRENNIDAQDRIIVIAPGARSHIKRWPQDRFIELIIALIKEFKAKVILIGDKNDAPVTRHIAMYTDPGVLDLTGKTSVVQAASLLQKAGLIISNDSAVLHLASYLNRPLVAIFGPTDEKRYGPWSDNCRIVKKEIFCRPCSKAQCRFATIDCMHLIKVEDVSRQVRGVLAQGSGLRAQDLSPGVGATKYEYKRILIVRTDRVGDVILSTPVIRVLRDNYPYAYIAMMVSPYSRDVVEGNPYLDQVIIYDKSGKHKSWFNSVKFALKLKKEKFDLAVILHPANRVHLLTFLAGIPKRLGYNRKLGFLLTDKIRHIKQYGEKHESEYNLDLLRRLGIEPKVKELFIPLKAGSETWAEELLRKEGINKNDRLLAIHPGASCFSKVWPAERFSVVCNRLAEEYGFKILLVAGPKDMAIAKRVAENIRSRVLNLAGGTSVSQLTSILKRCRLFISNDSGPVHIASALGTPVISIFGRSQKGLSPKRWGPLSKNSRILHKPAGCIKCLAHDCVKEFACLKAVTVDDVLDAVRSLKLF